MGIAMMFFNWVLFVVSIFAMIMFHLQIVNVEEEFLLEAFGEEYLSYRQKVCRYIGRKSESYLNFMRRNNRMITYRRIEEEELCIKLFDRFIRHQVVTKCWRKEEGEWVIKDVPFIDDWGKEEFQTLVSCLQNTIRTGGFVYGAFYEGNLKGFTSVESELFGGAQQYLDLSCIHVSEDMRGRGIGETLFAAAKDWAKKHGARKLYISGHSAVETQAFYKKMGCVEAELYNEAHVEKEPCDCQLECRL